MTDLSILCVSKGEGYSVPFREELERLAQILAADYVEFDGSGAEYIEQVLDEAVACCPDGYILRIDDDERVSQSMQEWLLLRTYRDADHWSFPRMHLWPTPATFIDSPPLWPDQQTRLSVKAKSGSRHEVHAGSPFGSGRLADVAIEHWKFIARSYEERMALVNHYEETQAGAGYGFAAFSLPEDVQGLSSRPVEMAA